MPERVDIFVPADQHPEDQAQPAKAQQSLDTTPVPDMQVRIVRNNAPVPNKRAAFDHLRPLYVVQRAQPSPGRQTETRTEQRKVVERKIEPPISKPRPHPVATPESRRISEIVPQRHDDIAQPINPLVRPRVRLRRRATRPIPQTHEDVDVPAKPAKQRKLRRALFLTLAGLGMLAVSVMLQATSLGEALIGLYAVFAIFRRVESRTTFMLALVSLGCILVMLLVHPNATLMKNFAIYAFLFMLVGTISLAREAR